MINSLLGLFAAAMLFVCFQHIRALLRHRQILREMYRAMDEAAENRDVAPSIPPRASVSSSGEHPIVRGVFVGTPHELRREEKA